MRSIHDTPPVFIGDIDLGNRTILRVDLLPRIVKFDIQFCAETAPSSLFWTALQSTCLTFRSSRC